MAALGSPTQLRIPPQGRLSLYSIVWLLSALGQVRATGVIDFTRSKLVRKLVLSQGKVQVLLSNAREDRLFDWLVSNETIAAERIPPALVDSLEDAPLTGKLLLMGGLIDFDTLRAKMREHVLELLEEASEWRDCQFSIHPGRVDLGDEPTLDVDALDLALEMGRHQAASSKHSALPPILVARYDDELTAGLELNSVERALLSATEKPIERVNLFETLGKFGSSDVQSALETFWRMGLLTEGFFQAETNVEEKVETVTRAELERWLRAAENEQLEVLLGVSAEAEPADVRKAYYRVVRRFHPDRFLQGPLAAFHTQIEQAMRIVHEALQVLSDPTERRRWERRRRERDRGAMDPSQVADQYVAQARAHAKGSRRSDAVYSLEQAVLKSPQHFNARFGLAILLAGNPRRRNEALQAFTELAKEKPGRADVHAAHALALEKAGQANECEEQLTRALAIDPNQAIVRAYRGDSEALKQARQDPFIALLLR